MMMFDLEPEVARKFWAREGGSAEATTAATGIDALLPGSTIQAHQFAPCGYSMNGLLGQVRCCVCACVCVGGWVCVHVCVAADGVHVTFPRVFAARRRTGRST
jgi:hypothetical protein